ncbi:MULTISPECIES: hypothetical protein [unclassified Pseudodesulfovibrio]|uniref:hypothetical protein n=1 Tax=unclassified Pseudodesulfovibrio TaxID=2661612 RepID=UPI000FEBFF65|nr:MULTISPECIES: hypothetical protein [unclassified Pseudodesulfovibrio]MCJ2164887.1 hypothetical protein [Pseudodesulfovibrio sp. S3-i]RWU03746.1 hypothetical protein DWB63_09820 [Pseudodesulfovibrio sp. S3]
MIDKATALETVLRRLDKLPMGHAMDMRTYKRNRSVLIRRTGPDAFEVTESGFHEERFLIPLSRMKKLLKGLLKKEFPRSTKIRLYDLGETGPDEHVERKKI